MADALTRTFADVSICSDGTGRTVHGLVVPFGATATVSDGGRPYQERFLAGSFTRTIRGPRTPHETVAESRFVATADRPCQ